MKRIILAITFLAASCSKPVEPTSTLHNAISKGQLRGAQTITEVVANATIADNPNRSRFDVSAYVDSSYFPSFPQSGGIRGLMGAYAGNIGASEYRNGTPNSVNMLFWDITMQKLSADLAACTDFETIKIRGINGERVFEAKAEFVEVIQGICNWDSDPESRLVRLRALWFTYMGFLAPQAEFQSWANFLMTDPVFAEASAEERLGAALYTLFSNPYFLIES